MKFTLTEVVVAVIAMFASASATAIGISWALQGRLTKIEGAVESIPKIEAKLDKVSDTVADQGTQIKLMDQKVVNIQANSKLTVKQMTKMNRAQQAAGALNSEPYGLAY